MHGGQTDRGVSEAMGVAALVLITVSATLAVGMTVIFAVEDPEDREADFDFEQIGDRLLITHDGGDTFEAGSLLIRGPEVETTWAANAELDADATIGPGDSTQIGPDTAYGAAVGDDDFIEIVFVTETDESVLAERGESDDPFE